MVYLGDGGGAGIEGEVEGLGSEIIAQGLNDALDGLAGDVGARQGFAVAGQAVRAGDTDNDGVAFRAAHGGVGERLLERDAEGEDIDGGDATWRYARGGSGAGGEVAVEYDVFRKRAVGDLLELVGCEAVVGRVA